MEYPCNPIAGKDNRGGAGECFAFHVRRDVLIVVVLDMLRLVVMVVTLLVVLLLLMVVVIVVIVLMEVAVFSVTVGSDGGDSRGDGAAALVCKPY